MMGCCSRNRDSTLGDTLLGYRGVIATFSTTLSLQDSDDKGALQGQRTNPLSSGILQTQKRHHTAISTPGLDSWVAQIPAQLCDLGQASSLL